MGCATVRQKTQRLAIAYQSPNHPSTVGLFSRVLVKFCPLDTGPAQTFASNLLDRSSFATRPVGTPEVDSHSFRHGCDRTFLAHVFCYLLNTEILPRTFLPPQGLTIGGSPTPPIRGGDRFLTPPDAPWLFARVINWLKPKSKPIMINGRSRGTPPARHGRQS